jgi:hypothetical protein
MSIYDLVLIFSVLFIAIGLLGLVTAVITHRGALARRLAAGLGVYIAVYGLVLVAVALLSPQQILEMHQLRCFDDWCVSVENVQQAPSIAEEKPAGIFYLVTIQVSSQAKRISQRARDAAVYLLDNRGSRYDISVAGQHSLETAGLAGQPLNSMLDAGGTFTYTAVFDLPEDVAAAGLVVTHGRFPGLIIIGSDQSFLHQPTVIRLAAP